MNDAKHYKELSKGLASAMEDVLKAWGRGIKPSDVPDIYEQGEHMLKVYNRFIEENTSDE